MTAPRFVTKDDAQALLHRFYGPSVSLIVLTLWVTAGMAKAQNTQSGASSATQQTSSASGSSEIPRGKKLVLKDGSVQPVREYEIRGDRVRYYSLDSSDWQEVPAALVDWDATKKLESEEAAQDSKLNSKVHLQEAGRLVQPLDIDASLEAAPGVFLPPGEGLFVFDGKNVAPIAEAEIGSKLSKKKAVEKVLVPIPIIPSRHTVSIHGAHATLRVRQGQTEFYMRTTDQREPELELVRAKVHGDSRDIANVDELFNEREASGNTLLFQRWEIAKGVYRFTLGQSLDPGEYALIEVIQDSGMNIYAWDFGVDPNSSTGNTKP